MPMAPHLPSRILLSALALVWGGSLQAQTIAKLTTPAQKVSLEGQERVGGHTIARHVGKDAEFIKNRVLDQALDAASTFRDLATAETVVQAALEANRSDINAKLFAPQAGPANVAYTYDAGKDIGSYLEKGNVEDKKGRERKDKALKTGATSVTLVVHFNWQAAPPHNFYVLTCYPNPK